MPREPVLLLNNHHALDLGTADYVHSLVYYSSSTCEIANILKKLMCIKLNHIIHMHIIYL